MTDGSALPQVSPDKLIAEIAEDFFRGCSGSPTRAVTRFQVEQIIRNYESRRRASVPQGSDRLEEIRLALRVAQSQGGAISVDFTCKAKDRMAWLIGEVERLRARDRAELPAAHELWKAISTLRIRYPPVPVDAVDDLLAKMTALRGAND